jgi:Uma2 family endonuclease
MARAVEQVGQIHQRLFTVEEYHRMAETGILQPDERVELIRGVVQTMSPKNRAHVVATTKLYQRLVKSLAGRAAVFKEDPLKLVQLDSEPEPDIVAASRPDIDVYDTASFEALLVVEVAESSLRFDLNAKAVLYAEAGVPEYWVLNLVDRELVVFWSAFEGAYRQRATYRTGDRVAPRAWNDVTIEVSELFLPES